MAGNRARLLVAVAAALTVGREAPVRADGRIPVIITLADAVDVASFADADKHARRARIVRALVARASGTPPALAAILREDGVADARRLWLINGVAATVTPSAARRLAQLPGVLRVALDVTMHAPGALPATAAAPEWNLEAIHAPELWQLGLDGNGVVVANMDSGVDVAHANLGSRWRGGSDSWWDPYKGTSAPYDALGHGTGTMGLLVGGSAGGSAIGVAPGARWIAAKIYDDNGNTTVSIIHQAFQWLLAPSGVGGAPDAPAVVSASWGLPAVNVCDDTFQRDLDALRAAGIVVVFAAGNSGPQPWTSVSPANNGGVLAAGAIDDSDTIASFSSRGAAACTNQLFPDTVAPGVNVKTAAISLAGVPQYAWVTGTSFSAPHVAGVAALLAGAVPDATVAEIEDALRTTARDLGPVGDDDAYGHGLVDAAAAYAALSAGRPLRVATAALPDGARGVPYAERLAATGGVAPYRWSLAMGSLPAGLALDGATGAIAGTPSATSSSFTVDVIDAAGTRASRALSIGVTVIPWSFRNAALLSWFRICRPCSVALTPRRGEAMTPSVAIGRLVRTVVLPAVALAAIGLPDLARAESPSPPRPAWSRTTARYTVPDVGLVRADGARVQLRRELDDGKPVIMNFIFTSCAAICPVMSQTFAEVQRRLGDERAQVHMVSVSIDPEADTPARLVEYARKFAAGPQWSFYTGSLAASISAQKAFDIYRGDKMNHAPVTFLRVARDQPWVRLEGFASADDVVAEYRRLRAGR